MLKVLDTVALVRDIPAAGLREGDLGAVVEIYPNGDAEIEFVAASGRTQALLTLKGADFRPVGDGDLLAVRSLTGSDS